MSVFHMGTLTINTGQSLFLIVMSSLVCIGLDGTGVQATFE